MVVCLRHKQVAAAKAYDRFARKLYIALELQAGNADPEPSKAATNFNLDGTGCVKGPVLDTRMVDCCFRVRMGFEKKIKSKNQT